MERLPINLTTPLRRTQPVKRITTICLMTLKILFPMRDWPHFPTRRNHHAAHVDEGARRVVGPNKGKRQLTCKPGSVGPAPCGVDVAAIHL
jgi:hypothetical protein